MTAAPRARILERVRRAAASPITVLLAPTASGKSVALDQFRAAVDRLHAIDASDLGDEDFAEALDAAIAQSRDGIIIVDGLQRVQSNPESAKALLARIGATIPTRRWILASPSSIGLPIGTWLAYGACSGVIGADELAFTAEEIRAVADINGCLLDDDETEELRAYTEGWAAGVGVAVRAIAAGADRAHWHAAVRDAAYRLFEERAYPELDASERELLEVAAALPEIEVPLLESAGFGDARRLLDSIHQRTRLLTEESKERYKAPHLFREFLRRRIDLRSADERSAIHLRAASALEGAGRTAAALDAYGQARSHGDLLRLLQDSGFDLLERGQSAVTARAIDLLSDAHKRSNPRILALRGVLHSLGGNSVRAEALLRRALSRAGSDRDLVAFARLKLAPLIANYGASVVTILDPVADDPEQPVNVRAEALSLRATACAMDGQTVQAKCDIAAALSCLDDVESDVTRAKVLQRVGVAAMYLRETELAKATLTQAGELSTELRLFSVASRSWSALSNLMCHEFDDVMAQLWYAERAAAAATEGNDALGVQTALLQVAAAEMRRGNAEESEAVEEQLTTIRSDPARAYLLVSFRALRLAWDGKFAEAHHLLAPCWNRMYHDFDKLVCGAQCALFLAIDDRRDASIDIIGEILSMQESINAQGLLARRSVSVTLLMCCVAETVNQRQAHASRLLTRMRARDGDPVTLLASELAEQFNAVNRGPRCRGEISGRLQRLGFFGYADVARLLEAASIAMDQTGYLDQRSGLDLTEAEFSVLKLLNEGLSNKEIAIRSKRSVFTIRAHVANLCKKLKCHGRGQAVATARRLEILM